MSINRTSFLAIMFIVCSGGGKLWTKLRGEWAVLQHLLSLADPDCCLCFGIGLLLCEKKCIVTPMCVGLSWWGQCLLLCILSVWPRGSMTQNTKPSWAPAQRNHRKSVAFERSSGLNIGIQSTATWFVHASATVLLRRRWWKLHVFLDYAVLLAHLAVIKEICRSMNFGHVSPLQPQVERLLPILSVCHCFCQRSALYKLSRLFLWAPKGS